MAEHCGRSEELGATISGQGMKGLEADGLSGLRVGDRLQGGIVSNWERRGHPRWSSWS